MNTLQLTSVATGAPIKNISEQLGYGLGLMGVKDPVLGDIWTHAGSGVGSASQMYLFKDKGMIITSTMSRRDNGQSINLVLINQLTEQLFGSKITVKTKLAE